MCRKEKFDKRTCLTILNQCKKEHRKEKRIYFCNLCQSWHLTKMEVYEEVVKIPEEELIFKDIWLRLAK